MVWHDAALAMAGVIGSGVAVVHGVLTQRLLVRPFQEVVATRIAPRRRQLVAILLQFSTFNWFVGGLALVAAACAFGVGSEARERACWSGAPTCSAGWAISGRPAAATRAGCSTVPRCF